MAEGRSKAQASSLRSMKRKVIAKVLDKPVHGSSWHPQEAEELRKGAVVLVEAGDMVPLDGEVIEGVASVDESAITGESAPVIRESGGDFSSVTGGTRVLSDWLVVRVGVNPGESFLDRMIAMVVGAKRQKTPNEIALTILLVALTIVFLIVTMTLLPFSIFSVQANKMGSPVTITALIALLVCLIPTTIGALLSAIGVAGMSRMMAANVIATSGRAVEAAGDVDVLLLDKTGTITLGNRQASALFPAKGVAEQTLADAAQYASLADETPEGRSIMLLAKQKFKRDERDPGARPSCKASSWRATWAPSPPCCRPRTSPRRWWHTPASTNWPGWCWAAAGARPDGAGLGRPWARRWRSRRQTSTASRSGSLARQRCLRRPGATGGKPRPSPVRGCAATAWPLPPAPPPRYSRMGWCRISTPPTSSWCSCCRWWAWQCGWAAGRRCWRPS